MSPSTSQCPHPPPNVPIHLPVSPSTSQCPHPPPSVLIHLPMSPSTSQRPHPPPNVNIHLPVFPSTSQCPHPSPNVSTPIHLHPPPNGSNHLWLFTLALKHWSKTLHTPTSSTDHLWYHECPHSNPWLLIHCAVIAVLLCTKRKLWKKEDIKLKRWRTFTFEYSWSVYPQASFHFAFQLSL